MVILIIDIHYAVSISIVQQRRHSATADPNELLQMKMSPLLLLCAAALVQGGSADKFMPAAGGEIN